MADRAYYEQFRTTPEGQALLATLRYAEGTKNARPYNTLFGGGQFNDLSRHPDKVIRGGGYSSAAAGAYQFMPGTWQNVSKALGLSDFGPQAQDIGALYLARQRLLPLGGLEYLRQKGLTPEALNALAPEWASLPTKSGKSYYGQPVKATSDLQKEYSSSLRPLSSSSGSVQAAGQPNAEPGTYTVKTRRMPVQNAAAFQNLIGEIQRGFGGGASTGDDKLYAAMAADAAGDPYAPVMLQEALSEPDTQSSGFNLNNLAKRFIEAATPQYVTDWEITPNGAASAPTATQPNAGPAQRLAVGRVVEHGKDVLPSTGPHLDVRVLKDGQYINPEIARSVLQNLYVGGKPLYSQVGEDWRPSYTITSRFGPRSAPTAGASTYHRGVDFGVPAGTPLEWRGGGTYKPESGYGVIQTGGPYEIRLLHTVPS